MSTAHLDPIGAALSGGRYEVVAKLGEGGMGAVYRARDHNIGADVVIKLPHRAMAAEPEFSRRFRDEVRSLIRLSHPYIVKVTDLGEWDGVPFAVLQFLPGGSLEDRQGAWRGPAALAALAGWLGPVADALDYVHSQKLVHRDVKPANILFDARGHAFLGDFGVVKVLASAADDRSTAVMTGTGMVLGTPNYMAPELIMGEAFDGRVDQYALAVSAYELLCGRRPFEHDVPTRVLMMHARDLPPRPAGFAPWLPPRLEEVLLRGLAKDPVDRYPSCSGFAAAAVEASGAGRGALAGRARVRCESCGRTLTVAVEALAKLGRSGRSAPCPKCKAPLDLTAGTATVLPPSPSDEAPSGGTALLDVHGSTAELRALTPQAVGAAAAGETVVLGGGRQTAPEGVPAAGRTVVEPPPPTAPEVARRPPAWVPLASAAAAVALVAGAAALWLRPSERPAGPATAAAPAPPDAPVLARVEPPLSSEPLATPSRAPAVGPETRPATEPEPEREPEPEPERESVALAPADPGGVGGPVPGPVAPDPPEVPDDEPLSARNVPLNRLLEDPGAFAGQLVTLEQVYCVARTPRRMPDGSLQVALIESTIDVAPTPPVVRLRDSFELGLDRRLAEELERQGVLKGYSDDPRVPHDWDGHPTNLTVKVADAPGRGPNAARIVRMERFLQFRPDVRGTAKKILVVQFLTQTVTPSGATDGLGNHDDWIRIPKLGRANQRYLKVFEAAQERRNASQWAQFNSQMNRVIAAGTAQSAASQAAAEAARRSIILGR